MKDAECAAANEKSNSRFFRCLVFVLWSFLYSKYGQVSMNFYDNSKNEIGKKINSLFIPFSTLPIIHKNRIKTEGEERGVCISLVGKKPFWFYVIHIPLKKLSAEK